MDHSEKNVLVPPTIKRLGDEDGKQIEKAADGELVRVGPPMCEYHPTLPAVWGTCWCQECREKILKLRHCGYQEAQK